MTERKLYRSRSDQMLGGVCAGIADYFEMDPSIVRMLAVVLAVIGNFAVVIAYIVLWVVVPEEPPLEPATQSVAGDGQTSDAAQASTPPVAPTPSVTPTPPAAPAPTAPTAPYGTVVTEGVRTGVVWFGVILIVFGMALLADLVYPDLNLWGFWPATMLGLLIVASGVHTMVTKGGDA